MQYLCVVTHHYWASRGKLFEMNRNIASLHCATGTDIVVGQLYHKNKQTFRKRDQICSYQGQEDSGRRNRMKESKGTYTLPITRYISTQAVRCNMINIIKTAGCYIWRLLREWILELFSTSLIWLSVWDDVTKPVVIIIPWCESNHYVVYLKLIQCYMSTVSRNWKKKIGTSGHHVCIPVLALSFPLCVTLGKL